MQQQLPANAHILVMAGGEGVRFAPLSTPEKPKQFLNLLDPQQSLLQQTWERLRFLTPPKNLWLATQERYRKWVEDQLPSLKNSQVIWETAKKNTAPTIVWSCHLLQQGSSPEALLAVLPADHFVTPTALFQQTLKEAFQLAQKEKCIVTLGVPPTYPSTEYGYLEKGFPLQKKDKIFKVNRFVEKPNRETAQKYFESQKFDWNAGIFIFPVSVMQSAIQKHLPKIVSLLETSKNVSEFFEKAPSISIDYGIMEKLDRLLMIETPFTWSDVGTWENLNRLAKEQKLTLESEIRDILELVS